MDPKGQALAAISDGLMHLHMRFYGKGPARAKTHFVDDTVICFLWDGFTKVEQTLIDRGEEEAVRKFRHTFQLAMKEQFVEVVEEATGRRVTTYLSEVNVNPNLAVELFLLAPEAEATESGEGADES